MSLPLYVYAIHPFYCLFRCLTIAVALSVAFSGCHSSIGASMEGEVERPSSSREPLLMDDLSALRVALFSGDRGPASHAGELEPSSTATAVVHAYESCPGGVSDLDSSEARRVLRVRQTAEREHREVMEVLVQHVERLKISQQRRTTKSLETVSFGKAAWQEYFGVDVGEEPDLPVDIETIWNSRSPFLLEDEQAHQRVGDNHLLTLIPGEVDGEAFTLDRLGALVLRNYRGHFSSFQGNSKEVLGYSSHGYSYYNKRLTKTNRHVPLLGAPYWVLLPKTILKDSRCKSVSSHEAIVSQYDDIGYKLPHSLEVATSLLAHYALSGGERLYTDKNQKGFWTYTRCLDVDKDEDPLAVGGFESSGLSVHYCFCYDDRSGVAASRKL